MRRSILLLLLSCACATQGTSAADYGLSEQAYTLTNLHPDEGRQRLYSVNYQQAGLIPMCTPVRIERVDDEGMTFAVTQTGRTYEYLFHGSMLHTPSQHLQLYFGPSCDTPEKRQLSELDLQGIAQGKALEGMSKAGVVYAMGYPPVHATANLEMDEWLYWKNKFDRVRVVFKDGVVVQIVN